MIGNLESVRRNRNMPFLRRGMKVNFNGEDGNLTSADSHGYVHVKVPGQSRTYRCHPWWQMTYYGPDGNVIAEYKEASTK